MATIAEIKALALHAAKGTAPENFSCENVNDAVRDQFAEMCRSINEFRRNQYDIFSILIETADTVVPPRVIERMGMFAEVRVVPQNTKVMFTRKLGKNRAKAFITRVGLSGVYETFRLDAEKFEVGVKAYGSAGTIDFERFLDGSENMSDIMEIITDGLEMAAYYEVVSALQAAVTNAKMPTANRKVDTAYTAANLLKICNTVRSYGNGAVIMACPEFVAEMGPDAIVAPIAGAAQGIYSADDIESIHNTGFVRIFRGNPIVQLPNSFIDEANDKTWMNPQYAFVFPTGKEKVVKLVFEGDTQMWLRDNEDQSMEIRYYKKMGAAILQYNHWGIYQVTGIADTSSNPYGF